MSEASYGGYDFLDHIVGSIHVACWVHARRKFMAVARLPEIKMATRQELPAKP